MDISGTLATIQGLSASVPGRTALFHSGTSEGVINLERALACVNEYPGHYYTIANTPVGQYLNGTFDIEGKLRTGVITPEQYDALWTQASRQFATEAQGKVLAFVGGSVNRNSVFMQTELDILIALAKLFRFESNEFCRDKLCHTVVVSNCGRAVCPVTAVFVRREVKLDRAILNFFGGGTQFLLFPRSNERTISVMVSKNFISVWRGFGDE